MFMMVRVNLAFILCVLLFLFLSMTPIARTLICGVIKFHLYEEESKDLCNARV